MRTQHLTTPTTTLENFFETTAPDMAARTMPPISKLPTEILEVILLEAIHEVTPPLAIDFKTGARNLRWKQDFRSGNSVLVGMLASRLVSHTFHKASWKTFGKVLGETI